MKNTRHPAVVLLVAVGAAFVPAGPAHAADQAAAAAAASADKPIQLEEFNVSSSKLYSFNSDKVQIGSFRDVNPVDVPLTINVITREALDSQAARTLFDAVKNAAGVTRAQTSGGSIADNIAIRGIAVENRGNYRLNGSLPVVNLVDLSLENKERVEVLKGATSLYYGFVPPSGVVNMVTKRATKEPVNAVKVVANSFGGITGQLDVGRKFGPGGQFGLRLNLARGREDIGVDHYSGDRRFIALAADWKVNDKILIRYDIEDLRKKASEQSIFAMLAPVAGVVRLPAVPRNTLNLAGEWQKFDARALANLLRVDLLLSRNWTLVAEAGHALTFRSRLSSQFQNYNLTTGAGTLAVTFNPSMRYTNDNYRVELYGRFKTAGFSHYLATGVTSNARDQDVWLRGNANFAQNLYNPVPVPVLAMPTATSTRTVNHLRDSGLYIYDRVTALEERIQVIAGIRSTDFRSNTYVFTTNNTTNVTTATGTPYSTKNKPSPMVTAAYKPTATTSIYLSYLEGLEAGATAGNAQANAGFVLPPLESRQYEIGAKAEFKGVLYQLGYFDIERPATFIDARNFLTSNGKAGYKGLEFFASGEVTRNLSLIASATKLDAKQLNAANAATFNRIPEGTAKYAGSLFGEWRVPQLKGLSISGGSFYIGNRPVNNANQGYLGGYTLHSVGAGYSFKSGKADVAVRLNTENVFDKATWAGVGGNLISVNLPRTTKLTVTTKF
jgi:iron complex outermembrane recepter protein